jgi:hypothetical protein
LEGLKGKNNMRDHSVDVKIILKWVSIFILAADVPLVKKEENVSTESKR